MTSYISDQTMNRLLEQIAHDVTHHLYHQWRDEAIGNYTIESGRDLDEYVTEAIIERYLEFRSDMKKRKRQEELFER